MTTGMPKIFNVDFMIEDGTDDGRNEVIEVSAPDHPTLSCKHAIIMAVRSIELKPGELIHMIHVGAPRDAK